MKNILYGIKKGLSEITCRIGHYIDERLGSTADYLLDHPRKVVIADVVISSLAFVFGLGSWAFWAHILLLQNWAVTFVSRARNSASLSRHLRAGFLSNFVWWVSQVIIFTKLWHYIQGKNGVLVAVAVGLYYTLFTLAGSIMAHAQSLRTERGKDAVGASKRYAQIPVEEWEEMKRLVLWEERILLSAEIADGNQKLVSYTRQLGR